MRPFITTKAFLFSCFYVFFFFAYTLEHYNCDRRSSLCFRFLSSYGRKLHFHGNIKRKLEFGWNMIPFITTKAFLFSCFYAFFFAYNLEHYNCDRRSSLFFRFLSSYGRKMHFWVPKNVIFNEMQGFTAKSNSFVGQNLDIDQKFLWFPDT